jgi:hypothetical protein
MPVLVGLNHVLRGAAGIPDLEPARHNEVAATSQTRKALLLCDIRARKTTLWWTISSVRSDATDAVEVSPKIDGIDTPHGPDVAMPAG